VKVDDLGFVTILGRAKRFSKIAGEMISLSAVESKLQQAFTEGQHAVVSVPDAKKGEQLVMFTTDETLDAKRVLDGMKAAGSTALMIPRNVIVLPELPVLGSGKTDYLKLNNIAREKVKP
jgi:acyl-[acyl-carrier-protein]-phospholipid O-acyltransferase/long-chain-fatty-acid--[acyl-carrier-protein] ligase